MPRGIDFSIIGDSTGSSGIWSMSEVHKYKTVGRYFPTTAMVVTGALNSTGTITPGEYTDVVPKKFLTYTSDGTLTVTYGGLFDFLLVAAGGGGGGAAGNSLGGSGGGAGGLLYRANKYIEAGEYAISIGTGGGGGSWADNPYNNNGGKGTDSTFGGTATWADPEMALIAKGGGGGGGGYGEIAYIAELDGGCSGGANVNTSHKGNEGDTNRMGFPYGYGNHGGESGYYTGSGGGGTLDAGLNGVNHETGGSSGGGGNGGSGLREGTHFNINNTDNYYGGGGGGGDANQGDPPAPAASGGQGGGGAGGREAESGEAVAGTANTGGGGGGGGGGNTATRSTQAGKGGGSGIVIIRYNA